MAIEPLYRRYLSISHSWYLYLTVESFPISLQQPSSPAIKTAPDHNSNQSCVSVQSRTLNAIVLHKKYKIPFHLGHARQLLLGVYYDRQLMTILQLLNIHEIASTPQEAIAVINRGHSPMKSKRSIT
jgi:hypothetical protein